jgi:hypothetical protein
MRGGTGSIVVAVGLVLVSLNCVARFAGMPGVVAYLLVGLPALALLFRYGIPFLVERRPGRSIDLALAVGTLACLLIAFVVLYPLANSGRIGPGSDRDEALNTADAELLAGRYPYYPRTYLGAPVTPMPGALLLALPFHLLGNAAYQNVFWMVAFLGLLAAGVGSLRLALLTLLFSLAGSPELLKEFAIGGDFGTNAIYVLIFTQLLVWTVASARSRVMGVVAAVAFGMACSSRPNFVLLAPLVFASLTNRVGWRRAAAYLGIALLAAAGMTLPFYFHDPHNFSPLHVTTFVSDLDQKLPNARVAVYGLAVLGSLGLAVRQYARRQPAAFPADAALPSPCAAGTTEDARLFLHCALVQAVPVLAAAAIACAIEPIWSTRSAYQMPLPLRHLSAGHAYVYFLVYAWALGHARVVRPGP